MAKRRRRRAAWRSERRRTSDGNRPPSAQAAGGVRRTLYIFASFSFRSFFDTPARPGWITSHTNCFRCSSRLVTNFFVLTVTAPDSMPLGCGWRRRGDEGSALSEALCGYRHAGGKEIVCFDPPCTIPPLGCLFSFFLSLPTAGNVVCLWRCSLHVAEGVERARERHLCERRTLFVSFPPPLCLFCPQIRATARCALARCPMR